MTDTPESVRQEQERHRLAFEEYFMLGTNRTYQKVARKLGVSTSTVKNWSRTFGWRERIADRDADAARQIADRTLQAGAEEQARNLKIVHMALMKLAKAIAEGKVRMQMGDLDRLIKLEAYLSGSPEDRSSWIDREADPEKLRARLREIAAASGLSVDPPPPEEASND